MSIHQHRADRCSLPCVCMRMFVSCCFIRFFFSRFFLYRLRFLFSPLSRSTWYISCSLNMINIINAVTPSCHAHCSNCSFRSSEDDWNSSTAFEFPWEDVMTEVRCQERSESRDGRVEHQSRTSTGPTTKRLTPLASFVL